MSKLDDISLLENVPEGTPVSCFLENLQNSYVEFSISIKICTSDVPRFVGLVVYFKFSTFLRKLKTYHFSNFFFRNGLHIVVYSTEKYETGPNTRIEHAGRPKSVLDVFKWSKYIIFQLTTFN
jgi:hypothetical protein